MVNWCANWRNKTKVLSKDDPFTEPKSETDNADVDIISNTSVILQMWYRILIWVMKFQRS